MMSFAAEHSYSALGESARWLGCAEVWVVAIWDTVTPASLEVALMV